MKRLIKILIMATAAASIIGVGALSYAAWTVSGGTEAQEGGGITGDILVAGNLTVTPSAQSGSSLDNMFALYPVDHAGSRLRYWEFTLSAEVAGGAPVYNLAGELTGAFGTNARLYWAASAPSSDTGAVPEKELGSVAKALSGLADKTDQAGKTVGKTVYVYMVATGTDAMKAGIKLTFAVTAAAS